MIESIYKDFVLNCTPKLVKVEEDGRVRTRIETTYSITELKTGKEFSKTTNYRMTDKAFENAIVKHFPESNAAKHISDAKGFYLFRTRGSLTADDVCSNMHTALRKLCDSKASSFWWHLIHQLPNGVMGEVWEAIAISLNKIDKPMPVHEVASVARDTMITTLEKVYYATASYSNHHRVDTDSEVGMCTTAFYEGLTNKQLTTYMEMSRLAYLSVPYLDTNDFIGMLGYLEDEGTEDV